MQSKAKANSIITHERLESGAIRFTVKGAGQFDLDVSKIHASNVQYAAVHGFIQRVSDGGAMGRNTETGASATPADKLARMRAIAEHYMSGSADWNLPRGEGGGKSITIQAIAEVRGIEYSVAEAYVDSYATRNYEGDRAEALAFLRTSGKVQEAIAAIRKRAERPANLDADAALEELTQA